MQYVTLVLTYFISQSVHTI